MLLLRKYIVMLLLQTVIICNVLLLRKYIVTLLLQMPSSPTLLPIRFAGEGSKGGKIDSNPLCRRREVKQVVGGDGDGGGIKFFVNFANVFTI